MGQQVATDEQDLRRNGWAQSSLLEPDCVEITLRIGIVVSGDHLQVQIESKDPSSDTLLSMSSFPHSPLAEYPRVIAETLSDLDALLERFARPF